MSIATKRGDAGKTDLIGRVRVSKSDARVECYGTIDELGSQIGFARSICGDAEVGAFLREVQRDLFRVGTVVATAATEKTPPQELGPEMLARLDGEVRRIEAIDGIVADWTIPGELASSAALDVARTVCRRAERHAVALYESGALADAGVLAYLNRLSDLLWLFGRLLEVRAGRDARLRGKDEPGKPWSRAW